MTTLNLSSNLVSANWLHSNLNHPDLVLLDASWHMPATGRNGLEEWRQERIGSARFFDYDQVICDPESSLPHTMPAADLFQEKVRQLGIRQSSVIVVYDTQGIFSSPRAWWMLKAMGHEQVAVLDGGLPAWQAAGFGLEQQPPSESYPEGDFVAVDKALFCNAEQVLDVLEKSSGLVLDARGADRFYGKVPEPREGLRSGHIPGSVNLPFASLLTEGLLKPVEQLRELLPDSTQPLYFSCGSGVTACILALAATEAGYRQLCVYDGSWSEWGMNPELPVERD